MIALDSLEDAQSQLGAAQEAEDDARRMLGRLRATLAFNGVGTCPNLLVLLTQLCGKT